jgi:hypothetical protein
MATNLKDLLPPAKVYKQKIAAAEAEKASEAVRNAAAEEAAKTSLIEQLSRPSGVSDEEAIGRAIRIIDRGRAINQQEPGWEATLTGVPKEIYELWSRYFRDQGYRLRVQIIDFPGGMPGDVGMTLAWG